MNTPITSNNSSLHQRDSGMMLPDILFNLHILDLSELPLQTTFVYDILFQPESLDNLCFRNLFQLYIKVTLPKSMHKERKTSISDKDDLSPKQFFSILATLSMQLTV